MKIIIFLASLLCFFLYLLNHREEERTSAGWQRDRQTENAKERAQSAQESVTPIADDFYTMKLETLGKMLMSASEEVEREERRLEYLNTLNQYGAVINDKNIRRAEADLYKARRKKLTIVSQIHSVQKAAEQAGK